MMSCDPGSPPSCVRHPEPALRGEGIEENVADGVVRSALLVGSENAWLRRNVSTLPFVRRAVRRFMPGERLEAAIATKIDLRPLSISTVLNMLSGYVTDDAGAAETWR